MLARNPTLPLLLLTLVAFCTGDQWLMHGDFISELEAQRHNLELKSTNSTTSVSSAMRVSLVSPPGHRINCILAAALHMNGDVSIVEGGIGSDKVTLAYATVNGKQDLFFVLIESYVDRTLRIGSDEAGNARISIVFDQLKDWGSDMGDPEDGEDSTIVPNTERNEG